MLIKTLDIVVAPDPILKKKANKVKKVDKKIQKLMNQMLETMYGAPGIGLAAPQVGVSKQIIVIDVSENKDNPLFLINPVITNASEDTCIREEGCLSAPDQFGDVERPCEITVEYLDYYGEPQKFTTDGLLATCIQHEIDHLKGIMFYEHLSTLRKHMMIKKLKKMKK